jgi:enoyl-[acyl-carrier protein] reductase I
MFCKIITKSIGENLMGFLSKKRALITGLISDRSIAFGIAQAMHREGAELAFTYQNEKIKNRIEKIVSEFNSNILLPCDVAEDQQIEELFSTLKRSWDSLDILVHSIAYAPKDQLEGNYIDHINREGFKIAHDISSYSLGALAKFARPMMKNRKTAILTLSYIGAMQVIPNYNVMGIAKASLEANVRYLANSLGPDGIRVNAVSSGPIKTLAASGISDFKKMLDYSQAITPLRETVTLEQVGNASAFLCSDLASGITGEILYVDNGFHIVGMSSCQGF